MLRVTAAAAARPGLVFTALTLNHDRTMNLIKSRYTVTPADVRATVEASTPSVLHIYERTCSHVTLLEACCSSSTAEVDETALTAVRDMLRLTQLIIEKNV